MRTGKFAFALIFALSFSTSIARAAGSPVIVQSPSLPPKFFTRTRIFTLSVGAAMMAADIITTHQALQVPGAREANPLGQSEGARYALKFAGFGAGVGISYALHRTGHYKAARWVPMIIGVPSFAAAIHNSGIHK
jgi:hypothetical protein